MPVEITIIEEPSWKLVAAAFDDLAAEMEFMGPPLEAAAQVAAYDAARRFDEEGPGWAEWVLGYQSPAGHGTIGDLTGEMSARAGTASEYEVRAGIGGGEVTYHLEQEKEIAFEHGNSRQVARPFVGLSGEGEDMVEAIFGAWLDSLVGSFGGGGGGIIEPPMLPPGVKMEFIPKLGRNIFRGAGGRFVTTPPGF